MFSNEGLSALAEAVKDPAKRKIIAKDETIVGGLVLILTNEDSKLVIEALLILLELSNLSDSREFLKNFIGLEEQLHRLSQESNPYDYMRELCSRLKCRLSGESQTGIQHHQLQQREKNIQEPPQHHNRSSKPFINSAKFKTIVLQIDGLNDKSDMESCRQCLLTVKGVVSITFDLQKHRSIIRVKPEVTAKQLAGAIHQSNTMVAGQIVAAESGEEHLLSLCEIEAADKENIVLPPYLSDDTSPHKVDDRAVKRFGAEEERGAAGWLGAAASFLARSFYW